MAKIPVKATLKAGTPQQAANILNVIRENGTANYQNYVPKADPAQNNIRAIGSIIMDNESLQNEFLSALINRIAIVLVRSKTYENPLRMFKKGTIELGEVIEEVWVGMCRPFRYDIERSENVVFKREKPNVQSAFHVMNYQIYYKQTIQNSDLQRAFLSWNGIEDLIAKIVEQMYTSANYDEWLVMKYMLAKFILNGRFKPVQIPTIEEANMKGITRTIKGTSNTMEFPSTEYNPAGVMNYSLKENQYLIMTAEFNAAMDVDVLASAFNMDRVTFLGHQVVIDGFDKLDTDRLTRLFTEGEHPDPNYTALTKPELQSLATIPAVIVDRDWFMIYDNLIKFGEIYNPEGLYWNYTFHTWKTFSSSPFSNALTFVPGQPQISGVTVTPTTATVMPGGELNFTANITAQNFANKAVNWSVTPADKATVDIYGNVKVNSDAGVGSQITVTATSVFDDSKKGTATVTVGAALNELLAVPASISRTMSQSNLWQNSSGDKYDSLIGDTSYANVVYNNAILSADQITSVSLVGTSGSLVDVTVQAQKTGNQIVITASGKAGSYSALPSGTRGYTVTVVTTQGTVTFGYNITVN